MIDVLSPDLVREHYRLADYPYFIEFTLQEAPRDVVDERVAAGSNSKTLATRFLKIAAVVNHKNKVSKRVLEKPDLPTAPNSMR